jgi:hypothetical protein
VSDFEPVVLGNGEVSLRDRRTGEIMHPGLGPRREAELLYVEQTSCAGASEPEPAAPGARRRARAATNALAVIGCAEDPGGRELHLTILERDDGPLRLVLAHPGRSRCRRRTGQLLESLLERRSVEAPGLRWTWLAGDALQALERLEDPQDVICFDPFSPGANPDSGASTRWRVSDGCSFPAASSPPTAPRRGRG